MEVVFDNGKRDYDAIKDSEASEGTLPEGTVQAKHLVSTKFYTWVTLFLVCFINISDIVFIHVVKQYLKYEWDLSFRFEVLLRSSVFLCYQFGGLLFENMSDKIGKKNAMVIALTTYILLTLTSALSVNEWMFLVTRAAAGICVGANFHTGRLFANEASCTKHRLVLSATAVEATMFFLTLHESSVFINSVNWQWFVVIQAVPVMLAVILVINIPVYPGLITDIAGNKEDEGPYYTLQRYYFWKNTKMPLDPHVSEFDMNKGEMADLKRQISNKAALFLIGIILMENLYLQLGLFLFIPFALSDGICTASTTRQRIAYSTHEPWDLAILILYIIATSVLSLVIGTLTSNKYPGLLPLVVNSLKFILIPCLLFCFSQEVTKYCFFLILFLNFTGLIAVLSTILDLNPTGVRDTACDIMNCCWKFAATFGILLTYILYQFSSFHVIISFCLASFIFVIASINYVCIINIA